MNKPTSTTPQTAAFTRPKLYVSAVLAVCFSLLLASVGLATTYVMPTDQNLLDKSHLVVVATLEGSESTTGSGVPATDYQFRVERVLKGFVLATDIVVQVPGGLSEDGLYYKIYGTPSFERGQRTILFLQQENGVFRVSDMELGAFLEGGIGSTRQAYRSVSASAVTPSNDPLAEERQQAYLPRDFSRFSQWLADRASGIERPADYFLKAEDDPYEGLIGVREDFKHIQFGCPQGNSIARWRQFEEGSTVGYKMFNGGQSGVPGGGFTQFSKGIQSWNKVSASKIELRYTGTTGSNAGGEPAQASDRNPRFIPDDPKNIITGSFNPTQGGTLAITQVVTDCVDVRPFGNLQETRLVDADIITQDGTGSNFWPNQQNAALAFERVITHEIGHALGLSHSCGGNSGVACNGEFGAAIMRPNYIDSLLGGTLGSDDKKGARFIYPAAVQGGNVPEIPTDLTATPLSTSEIQITWNDNSNNETSFLLQEREIDSTEWVALGNIGANATSVVHEQLDPRTARAYRIAAVNGTGTSAFSNEAQATTNAIIAPCVSGDNTLCINQDRFAVTVNYLDQSDNSGQGTRVEITEDTGYFYFFNPANVEMVVKVLDACAIQSNHFWVFAGGLTDQQVELIVTDTETGRTNTYFNQLKNPFEPVQDTKAFATCP